MPGRVESYSSVEATLLVSFNSPPYQDAVAIDVVPGNRVTASGVPVFSVSSITTPP